MGCVQNPTFTVLINGASSIFFHASRGICQGYPLDPFIFLLVVEALKRLIKEEKSSGKIKGVAVIGKESLSHLLFVEDILYFTNGSLKEDEALRGILNLFCKATCMVINVEKYCIIFNKINDVDEARICEYLPYPHSKFLEGFKYLSFSLNPITTNLQIGYGLVKKWKK
jgi:hypothetical protein